MTSHDIPLHRPSAAGNELDYVARAVRQGAGCGGPFGERVTELLRAELGVAEVLLTTSCTSALELSALLLNLRPGDVVIAPSFAYVSTATAFARAGARIRFADIEEATLGLDPASVERLMGPEVRAVVPVHYAGVASDLDGLSDVVAGTNASIVEDNAHGLFGAIDDRPLGSVGRFSCLSFHETKNFACGEGGALCITDPADVERAHVLHDKGTNRREFLAGRVGEYSWVDTGSSFGMADLLAAHLLAQLERRDAVMADRRRIAARYTELLEPHAADLGFTTGRASADRTSAFHVTYVLLDDAPRRDPVIRDLRADGIGAAFHYVPLHSSLGAKEHLDRETDCPVTDSVSARLVRLPMYEGLTDADIGRVVDSFVRAATAHR